MAPERGLSQLLPESALHQTTKAWKRPDGSELDGSEHFEKKCQNVPGAAGAAVGAAAASAVCILSCTYMGARSAPL